MLLSRALCKHATTPINLFAIQEVLPIKEIAILLLQYRMPVFAVVTRVNIQCSSSQKFQQQTGLQTSASRWLTCMESVGYLKVWNDHEDCRHYTENKPNVICEHSFAYN